MSVARVTEIISSSKESFEDATRQGLKRASQTLKNVRGAWIEGQKVECDSNGHVTEFRVILKVTFVLQD
jgi:dodecin